MDLKNKTVTVAGLGESGYYAAKLLKHAGAKVKVTESKESGILKEKKQNLQSMEIEVEIGGHTEEYIKLSDLVVISPGMSDDSYPFKYAKDNNIPVIGEVELGYNFCDIPIIAVSGTNGKTTVTTMTADLLNRYGIKSVACGNIGFPLSRAVMENSNDMKFFVTELSSFQLERINSFHPFISVLLDVDYDHLDRHGNFNSYKKAKYKIFKNLK